MKDLLTVRIVLSIKDDFNKFLLTSFKENKRTSLLQLYQTVRRKKDDSEINRDEIFLKLFKKKWTKDNDYLLRNELKILKDKIEEYYIEYSKEKYLKEIEDKILLDFYKDLKITDQFITLYKEYQTIKNNQFEQNDCIEYSFYYADFIRINTPNYLERAKLLEENLLFFENKLHQFITIQQSRFDLMKSHVLLQQKQIHNKTNINFFEYTSLVIDTKKHQNILSDYYIAYANAYTNFDTSTIEQWENVYTLLQKIPAEFKDIQTEVCFTLSNLATICSIRLDFKKSDYYFHILFTTVNESVLYQNVGISLNFITNLNKLKKYNEAEIQLNKSAAIFGDSIKKTPQFRTQEMVIAFYLKDAKKLKKLFAIDFELLQPFERIFYRLFYCIYFIQDEQIDFAFTEIQNLQRSKLMKEIDTHFGLVADYFFVCIKHLLSNNGKKKLSTKAINEIQIANTNIVNANVPMLLNYAPYLWMKDKMNV